MSSKLSAVEIYMMCGFRWRSFSIWRCPRRRFCQILLLRKFYLNFTFWIDFKCSELLTMNPGAPFFPGDPFSPCKTKAVELSRMCNVCFCDCWCDCLGFCSGVKSNMKAQFSILCDLFYLKQEVGIRHKRHKCHQCFPRTKDFNFYMPIKCSMCVYVLGL